jgi:hypothetical protein
VAAIFVTYRRADAQLLADHLVTAFGRLAGGGPD